MSLNSMISASATDTSALSMKISETSPLLRSLSTDCEGELDKKTPLDWSSPTDPHNPKNWPPPRKWATAILVSFYALASAMSPAMIVPAIPQLSHDLNLTSENSKQLLVSIYVLSWCLGPLFWAPMSEAYGRVTLLNLGTTLFLIANLLCGFESDGKRFLALRFVAGFVGSAGNAIGGGLMSDLWIPEERGRSLAVYAVVPLLGSAVGAIFGGFLVQSITWRWLFWGTSAFVAVCLAIGFLFLQETFPPVILRQKQKKRLSLSGDSPTNSSNKSLRTIITVDLPRPFILVSTQPIIWALGLYMAYLWGLNFLMISTYQSLWQDKYGQTSAVASLNYISISLGFVIGCEIAAPANDKIYALYKTRNKNVGVPEFRTIMMLPASALVPLGLLIYGWTAQFHLHFLIPNLGMTIYCIGLIIGFQCIQAYILDTYPLYAASAIGSLSILRAASGFAFPLLGPLMFRKFGYGWASTMMAAVAAVIGVMAPVGLKIFGPRLRAKSPYAAGDGGLSL